MQLFFHCYNPTGDEDTLNIKVDTCQILDGSLRPESAKQFLEKGFVCKDIYSKEVRY